MMEGCLVASSSASNNNLQFGAERRYSHADVTSLPSFIRHRVSQGSLLHQTVARLRQNSSHHFPFRVPSALLEDTLDEYDESFSAPQHRYRQRIRINVSGLRFEGPRRMFARHPDTLLGNPVKRRRFYDADQNEFYFDRDPGSAEAIFEYYQTGRLRRPEKVPLDLFLADVKFFELSVHTILRFCDDEGHARVRPHRPPRHPTHFRVWRFMMDPHSSRWAWAFAAVGLVMVLVSIVTFCLETLPIFQTHHPRPSVAVAHAGHEMNSTGMSGVHEGSHAFDDVVGHPIGYDTFLRPMFLIELACVVWFTAEFVIHFMVCPDKKRFARGALNIIDLLAIVPFYIHVVVSLFLIATESEPDSHGFSLTVLHILHLVRVFRIFKLSQYSRGMRILGETFKTSVHELGLCLLFLCVGIVLFSTAVYCAEHNAIPGIDSAEEVDTVNGFGSIPGSFYWAGLTMTTVGFSGATPRTLLGKLVGSVCALSGLIAVSLPVPVIVANFTMIYERDKERHHVEEILTAAIGIHYTSTSSFHV